MGHLSFYNKNQIRDRIIKLLPVLIFLKQVRDGGKEERVRIECDNSLAGVMVDRFGKDVSMIRLDDKRFVVNVEVAVSRQFLAWIIGLT